MAAALGTNSEGHVRPSKLSCGPTQAKLEISCSLSSPDLSSFLAHRRLGQLLISRRPSQSLVQVRRESVLELTGVRRQVHADLLEIINHDPPRALVAAVLPAHKPLPLVHAARDCPHQQVRHVDGHRLRQPCKLGRVVSDRARISARVQWEDLKGLDFL